MTNASQMIKTPKKRSTFRIFSSFTIVCLFTAFLAGCKSSPSSPSEGMTLILPAWKPKWRLISGFSGGELAIAYKQEGGCGKVKENFVFRDITKELPLLLPAGEDLILRATKMVNNRACIITGAFTPQMGSTYEVSYLVSSKQCAIQLSEYHFDGQRTKITLRPATNKGKTLCEP